MNDKPSISNLDTEVEQIKAENANCQSQINELNKQIEEENLENEINKKDEEKVGKEQEIEANNKRIETINEIKGNVVALDQNFSHSLLMLVEEIKTAYLERNSYTLGIEEWITKSGFSSKVQDTVNQGTVNGNVGTVFVSMDGLITNIIKVVGQYETNFEQLDKQLTDEIKE